MFWKQKDRDCCTVDHRLEDDETNCDEIVSFRKQLFLPRRREACVPENGYRVHRLTGKRGEGWSVRGCVRISNALFSVPRRPAAVLIASWKRLLRRRWIYEFYGHLGRRGTNCRRQPWGNRGPKKWKAGLARPFAKNRGSYPNNCCNFPNRRLNSKVSEFLAFLGANFRRIVATFPTTRELWFIEDFSLVDRRLDG